MKVILRHDITNIGKQGDIKEIKIGYARNYLIPKQLAMEATPQNLKVWEKEKVKLQKERDQIIDAAKELAAKLEKTSMTITVNVGENNKLFGSVTATTIAKTLEENGFSVEKYDILLAEPIKEIGVYVVDIRVHPQVIAKAKFWVVEEKKEKEETTEKAEEQTAQEQKTEETPL
jgi:large subunit ribosomal protein L9